MDIWRKKSENAYEHFYPGSEGRESCFYYDGMFLENSGTYNLTGYYSLLFDLVSEEENEYAVTVETVLFHDGKAVPFLECGRGACKVLCHIVSVRRGERI